MKLLTKPSAKILLLEPDIPQKQTGFVTDSLERAGGFLWLMGLALFPFPFRLILVEGRVGELPSSLTGFDVYLVDLLLVGALLYLSLSRLPGIIFGKLILGLKAGSVKSMGRMQLAPTSSDTPLEVGVSRPKLVWWSLIGLVIWGGISILWAREQAAAFWGWARLLEGLGLAGLSAFYTRRYGPKWAAWALALSGAVQGGVALDQFIEGQAVSIISWPRLYAVGEPDSSVIGVGPEQYLLRAYGTFSHPNLLGGFLVISLLAALWLIWNEARKWRWLAGIAAMLSATGLALSFSRSAWVGLLVAAGGGFLLWLNRARPLPSAQYSSKRAARRALEQTPPTSFLRRNVGWLLLITAALFAIALFVPGVQSRLFGLNQPLEQRSIEERVGYAETALQIFSSSPVWGVGLNNFTVVQVAQHPVIESVWPVHNVPLLIAAEMGLIGLAFWLMLPLALALEGWRYFIRRQNWTGWAAACLALLVISQFDHYLWSLPQGQFLFFAVFGIWSGDSCD